MPLVIGARLGSYEVLAPIGAGGMGEVYRAQDTDLKRQVALKVLPAMVAKDPERLARFQREAEVLATLNHPHIAHVYGLEKSTGTIALVMELVEGPTVADRIAQGPIPLDEALAIGRQMAAALTAAHDQGIIHRDLKPANVKVRDDGTVKVLDFGLAKLADPTVASDANLTISPTLTSPAMTRVGVILGTAAYMAPEQARGKAVDKRADIWAFGCVLFEMVTGKRLFQGEDLTETLASIVKEQPDLTTAPRQLHRLLAKCLEKDPKKRLRDLGDVWDLLDDGKTLAAPAVVARRSNWLPWTVAGIAIAVAVVGFVAPGRSSTGATHPLHLFVDLPEGTAPPFFALSPDSRSLAMSAQLRFAVRSLETGELRPLTGTEGARAMFWSPDSRTIAFFSTADHKLKTIPAAGGVPQTLCDDVEAGGGGTWSRDGTILFDSHGAVLRTTASGGSCTEVIKATTAAIAMNPSFLPDGDHFLYFRGSPDAAQSGVYVASPGDPSGKRLLGDVSSALFAPDAAGSTHGRLLFVREQALMAQAFDAASLAVSGDPVQVADHVTFTFNALQIAASVSDDGTLIYATNTHHARKMVWYERSGTAGAVVAETGTTYAAPAVSPDGKRLAYLRAEALDPPALFVHDFERKQAVRLTRPPFSPGATVWAPDGQRLAFAGAGSPQTLGLHVISANGGAPQLILPRDNDITSLSVSDWSHDGRFLFFTLDDPKTAGDLWVLPVNLPGPPGAGGSAGTPAPLLRTAASESQAQLSPDGKWLAYSSIEAGANVPQVFVRPFAGAAPLPETRWQVSTTSAPDAGGIEPRWRGDSKELFYLEFLPKQRVAHVMAVPFGAGPNPAGTPKLLFTFSDVPIVQQANVFLYAPSPDGQRFLVDAFASDARPTLEVILKK